MKKVKELQANSIYLVSSRSCSSDVFFEDNKDIRVFMNQFHRHLNSICEIICYYHCSEGYVYLIKIKSEKEILEKCKLLSDAFLLKFKSELWRLISEKFRLMGSSYVSITNRRKGRKGVKFCRSYERYEIEDEQELDFLVKTLQNGNMLLSQSNEKYRPSKTKKTRFWSSIGNLRKRSFKANLKKFNGDIIFGISTIFLTIRGSNSTGFDKRKRIAMPDFFRLE